MYLKSIELYGFKSFAERTKIELNENITCIVGPNGSGKSNITDAIRWVLGEQSTITLRGSKMQDVIFSGTNNRRALGMAEVIITFDNSSNFLDSNYNEIEVKRKLYKNGDSEYYINNSPCRLKDVRELFMDTGIGRDGYSIIGQGRIDAILNSKPQERRAIFEEASGISKFKAQKIEVERKLKNTKENITRLADLLVEVEKQKDNLEIEAKNAEKYNEIYYKILEGEIKNSSLDLRELKDKYAKFSKEKKELLNQKTKLQREINLTQENFNKSTIELENIEIEINKLQITNVENIKLEKDLSNKISILNEKLINDKKELELTNLKTTNSNNDLEYNVKELNEISEKLKTIKNKENKYKEKNISLKNSLFSLKNNYSKVNKETDEINLNITKINNEISKNQIKLNTLESLNEERIKSKENISKDFSKLEKNKIDIDNSLNKTNNDLESLEKEMSDLTENLNSKLLLKDNIIKEIIDCQDKSRNLDGEINNTKLRISTLENLEESYEGYNRSIRDFFKYINRNKLQIKELHDTVGNLLEVEPAYEKAITTALGGNSQNLVVDTYKSAQNIINILKKENLGRITFFPLDNIKSKNNNLNINNEGFIDFAVNLVDYKNEHREVFQYLLSNVIIAKDLNFAKNIYNNGIKHLKIVTLDGDILYPGGSVSGGSFRLSGNIFNRKNSLNKLRKKTLELELNKEIVDDKLLDKNKIFNSLEKEIKDYNNDLNLLKDKISKEERVKAQINYSIENNVKNIDDYNILLKDYSEKIFDTNKEIQNLKKEKENLINQRDYLFKKEKINAEDLNIINKDITKYNELLNNENLKIGNLNNETSFIIKDKDRTENTILKLKDEIENLKVNEDLLNKNIKEYESEIKNLREKLNEIVNVNKNFDINLKNLASKKKEIMINYNSNSDIISDIKEELLELDKNLYFIEQDLKNNDEKVKNTLSYIEDNYKFSLLDNNLDIQLDESISKSNIKKLKQDLNNLGLVNLGSIKSYKDVKERFEFTLEQYNDLIETEEKLKNLLKKIEKTMEDKFKESFERINQNFNRIFKYLFNGGRAELIIEDNEDPIYAGVDIIAQLPGKKKQLLNAMSGGERSMTTVALLFSLLETRPSPFCLLDEVDAALDEANIKRFLSYLKTLDNIQFAIITHRKSTMAAANYIYGITMEEPGISKVISLNFDRRNKEDVQVV